jgi:hypothetical protein
MPVPEAAMLPVPVTSVMRKVASAQPGERDQNVCSIPAADSDNVHVDFDFDFDELHPGRQVAGELPAMTPRPVSRSSSAV